MVNYHYLVRLLDANSTRFFVTTEQLNYLLKAVRPRGLKVIILDYLPARTHRISRWDKRLYNHLLSSYK